MVRRLANILGKINDHGSFLRVLDEIVGLNAECLPGFAYIALYPRH